MWKIKKIAGGFITAGDEDDVVSFLNSLPKEVADSAKVVAHKYTLYIYYYENTISSK